jgi:hypothetical protein
VLIKPKSWEHHGLKPWIEAAKKRCITTCLPLRSPTSSPASPEAFCSWPGLEDQDGHSPTAQPV